MRLSEEEPAIAIRNLLVNDDQQNAIPEPRIESLARDADLWPSLPIQVQQP